MGRLDPQRDDAAGRRRARRAGAEVEEFLRVLHRVVGGQRGEDRVGTHKRGEFGGHGDGGGGIPPDRLDDDFG
jgi:hypothetical protein